MGIDKLGIVPYTLDKSKGDRKMKNSISINDFIFLCNDYLANSRDNESFRFYTGVNGFFSSSASGLTFNEDALSKIDGHFSTSTLDVSYLELHDSNAVKKFTYIVEFIINNKDFITDSSAISKEKVLQNLAQTLALTSTTLPLSEETYQNLEDNFKLYDKNMTVPKTHPIRSFLGKKIGIPALVTSVAGAITAGVVSTLPMIANSSFASPNPAINFMAWFTSGAVISLAGGLATFSALHKGTIKHYQKKYGSKSKNFELMRELDIQSVKDLESCKTKLPIKELLEKLQESNTKILENNSGNWFKRNIANHFQKKFHRNQLWAISAFVQSVRKQAECAHTTEERNRCRVMLDYLDAKLSEDARQNFESCANSCQKLANVDIYATIMAGRTKKDKLQEVVNNCHKFIRKLSLEHFTTTPSEKLFDLSTVCAESPVEVVVDETIPVTDTEVESVHLTDTDAEVESVHLADDADYRYEFTSTIPTEYETEPEVILSEYPEYSAPETPATESLLKKMATAIASEEKITETAISTADTTISTEDVSTSTTETETSTTKAETSSTETVVSTTDTASAETEKVARVKKVVNGLKVRELKSKYKLSVTKANGETKEIEIKKTKNPELNSQIITETIKDIVNEWNLL